MLVIFSFLKDYWQIILSFILIIVSFILALVKKKPFSNILEEIYYLCILAVIRAEESGLKGKDKLTLAIQFVVNSLKNKFPDFDESKYLTTISMIIEEILTTPQKK